MKRLLDPGVVLCLVLAPAAAVAERPFASLSMNEALKKAAKEQKLVLIDFYATWCMPCKMMDATTFKDAKVVDFLEKKVVALKIDAEKNTALAAKYHVSGFPTLLFVKPDGKVVEVIGGLVDAETLLGLAEGALAGKDTLTRCKNALKQSPNDPLLHALTAEALTVRGEHREALKHATFVLEKPDLDLIAAGMVPAVVAQITSLAEFSADAETSLDKFYEAAGAAVQNRNATNAQIALYAAMHLLKGEQPAILAAYDRLLAARADREYLQRVTALWREVLIAAERYQDVAEHVNILAVADAMIAKLPETRPGAPGAAPGFFDPEGITRQQVFRGVLDYYKVLTALGRHTEADALATRLTKVEQSADLYNALAWTAYETGKLTEANLLQARRAHELAGGKDVSVIDTLARVLFQLGHKDEAVGLIKRSLKWAQPGFEVNILAQCLADFGQ